MRMYLSKNDSNLLDQAIETGTVKVNLSIAHFRTFTQTEHVEAPKSATCHQVIRKDDEGYYFLENAFHFPFDYLDEDFFSDPEECNFFEFSKDDNVFKSKAGFYLIHIGQSRVMYYLLDDVIFHSPLLNVKPMSE